MACDSIKKRQIKNSIACSRDGPEDLNIILSIDIDFSMKLLLNLTNLFNRIMVFLLLEIHIFEIYAPSSSGIIIDWLLKVIGWWQFFFPARKINSEIWIRLMGPMHRESVYDDYFAWFIEPSENSVRLMLIGRPLYSWSLFLVSLMFSQCLRSTGHIITNP